MENIYYHISAADAYTITDRPCILHSITVNTTAAGAITVSDGTNTVAVLKGNIVEGTYLYDIVFKVSLGVTTVDTNDITIAYRPAA